jgi:hypothetical protein
MIEIVLQVLLDHLVAAHVLPTVLAAVVGAHDVLVVALAATGDAAGEATRVVASAVADMEFSAPGAGAGPGPFDLGGLPPLLPGSGPGGGPPGGPGDGPGGSSSPSGNPPGSPPGNPPPDDPPPDDPPPEDECES